MRVIAQSSAADGVVKIRLAVNSLKPSMHITIATRFMPVGTSVKLTVVPGAQATSSLYMEGHSRVRSWHQYVGVPVTDEANDMSTV